MKLGIDLGGTKIAAAVLDDRGSIVWQRRVPTPAGDYAGTIVAIAGLVDEAERAIGGRCSVGLGTPGATSPATGRIKNANSTWLIGQRFQQDIEARLGRDVRMANDANCLAISEAVDGAAAGAKVVFGVILGTGVGGGLVVNGEIISGANAIAGEWGHNPLPWPADDERPGPRCYCGRDGCIETFLSGPGLANDYRARGGAMLTAEAIVARAAAGDQLAAQTVEAWESRLARSLATVINVVDPDVIVAGGGLSNVLRVYENVPPLWRRWVFSDVVTTPFVQAQHGDTSGVRGAARLWGG
jgi:predicted NBD/HSP70 family sugar kinase